MIPENTNALISPICRPWKRCQGTHKKKTTWNPCFSGIQCRLELEKKQYNHVLFVEGVGCLVPSHRAAMEQHRSGIFSYHDWARESRVRELPRTCRMDRDHLQCLSLGWRDLSLVPSSEKLGAGNMAFSDAQVWKCCTESHGLPEPRLWPTSLRDQSSDRVPNY